MQNRVEQQLDGDYFHCVASTKSGVQKETKIHKRKVWSFLMLNRWWWEPCKGCDDGAHNSYNFTTYFRFSLSLSLCFVPLLRSLTLDSKSLFHLRALRNGGLFQFCVWLVSQPHISVGGGSVPLALSALLCHCDAVYFMIIMIQNGNAINISMHFVLDLVHSRSLIRFVLSAWRSATFSANLFSAQVRHWCLRRRRGLLRLRWMQQNVCTVQWLAFCTFVVAIDSVIYT